MLLSSFKIKILSMGALFIFSSIKSKKEGPPDLSMASGAGSIPVKTASAPYSIYLTFDDGPCAGSEIVSAMALKDSLSIDVFLIGKNAFGSNRYKPLLKDYMVNPYVEIGNHSYTHAERHYLHYFKEPQGVLEDFDRNRDSLHTTNNFARLPGRNFFRLESLSRNDISNGREAADTLAARGYSVFGWDVEWRNKANKGISLHTGKEMLAIAEKMILEKKTFNNDRIIILLHDPELRDSTFRTELENFIQLAKEDGRFRFQHLSSYNESPTAASSVPASPRSIAAAGRVSPSVDSEKP